MWHYIVVVIGFALVAAAFILSTLHVTQRQFRERREEVDSRLDNLRFMTLAMQRDILQQQQELSAMQQSIDEISRTVIRTAGDQTLEGSLIIDGNLVVTGICDCGSIEAD